MTMPLLAEPCGQITSQLTNFAFADQEVRTTALLSKLLDKAEAQTIDIVDRALLTHDLRSSLAYGSAIKAQMEDAEKADAIFSASVNGSASGRDLHEFTSFNRFTIIEHDLVMATALVVP